MARDATWDPGGEHPAGRDLAAWRDLVARFELPAPVDPAAPPWPEQENVPPGEHAGSGPGTGAHPGPGRIIRPASFLRSPVPDHPADPESMAGPEELASPEDPAEPDVSFLDFLDDEDPGDPGDSRYVPPPVGPMPKLDPVAKGAWAALFGGPAYLLIATILDWQLQGWAALLAIAAFITGFVILVSRLGDGPSRRDGPDQGAVVLPREPAADRRHAPVPGEVSGPDQAGLRAELGQHDRRMQTVLAAGEPILEGSPDLGQEQVSRLGHAATQHEASWIQDRRQVGQALAQPAPDDLKAAQRARVALPCRGRHLWPGDALDASAAQLQ